MAADCEHPRILMTADTIGGVWNYAIELAEALAARGATIALATMGRPMSIHQRVAAAAVPRMEVYESDFRLEWMNDAWDDVEAAGEWLLFLAERFQPDVVHLNGYAHAALPWPAPVLAMAHSCVCSWHTAIHGCDPGPEWDRYRHAVAAGLGSADRVAAPTAAMLASLRRHYGYCLPGCVLPNGRDPARHPPRAKRPYILAAGRVWDEAKNIATLARAARALPWPVYIAGEASHPAGGHDHGSAASFENVTLLGQLDPAEMAHWVGCAAIFAAPARYEPFGLAALEAGHAACALVLGDIPSQREIWDDSAVFADPCDPEALAAAIGRLIDEGSHAAWGERARRRALEFTPERMAESTLAVYRELLTGSPKATFSIGEPPS